MIKDVSPHSLYGSLRRLRKRGSSILKGELIQTFQGAEATEGWGSQCSVICHLQAAWATRGSRWDGFWQLCHHLESLSTGPRLPFERQAALLLIPNREKLKEQLWGKGSPSGRLQDTMKQRRAFLTYPLSFKVGKTPLSQHAVFLLAWL